MSYINASGRCTEAPGPCTGCLNCTDLSPCPACDSLVELWKDEQECPVCGAKLRQSLLGEYVEMEEEEEE